MDFGGKREGQERKRKVVTTAHSDHWSCSDRLSRFLKRDGLGEIMVLHCDRHLTCLGGSNALLWSRFNHAGPWGV